MKKAPGQLEQKPNEPVPGVHAGDHVFYKDMKGQGQSGEVVCHGRDGFTAKCSAGKHHRIRWSEYLGHKQRKPHKVKVVEEGEDGALVQHEDGRRVLLFGYPDGSPEFSKALEPRVLFLKAGPIKNKPGLTLTDVTDKQGHQTKRWTKPGDDSPGKEDGPRGAKEGFGTHHYEVGDGIRFDVGLGSEQGAIVAMGKEGATVRTKEGHQTHVRWDQVRAPSKGHRGVPARDKKKPLKGADDWRLMKGKKLAHEFSAHEHFKSTDKATVTSKDIIDAAGPDIQKKMDDAHARLHGLEETIKTHKPDGKWTAEREALHHKIIFGSDEKKGDGSLKYPGFLTPERIKAATPDKGRPRFTMLGGRGGSGKSKLHGMVYNDKDALVLDSDEIKKQLPEYEGHNAGQVHEESGEIFDKIVDLAQEKGLNMVHDITMKTPDKAVKLIQRFKNAGYHTSAHYMHLPRHMAAERALKRFAGKTGRLVHPDIILGNTENEKAFDMVKPHADEWSFWDNSQVGPEDAPELVSHSYHR